jgi:pSer/pThr/pTyr-binding forkhead associated (FHA) protein
MWGKLIDLAGGEGQRREIAITKEDFLIGRGSDCDLRLRHSAISRHHCQLRFRADEVTLSDLGSANGTFVNGQRVRSQAAVHHGDEIAFGDFRFVLDLEGASGISWGPGSSIAPENLTRRVDVPRPLSQPQKDQGHPPAQPGG